MPPAGSPTSIKNLAQMLKSQALSLFANQAGRDQNLVLTEMMSDFTGARYCYFMNSGRAALSVILNALSFGIRHNKVEVVIPAYTCFTVAAAIARCGLKIKPVDIDPSTLDYDYDRLRRLDRKRVLAIVGCNMFGILNNWSELHSFAKTCDVFLIDDAAQSMGSSIDGKSSGTFGDAGFYSLGRGKNLSAYSGGIVVTNDEAVNDNLLKEIDLLGDPGPTKEAGAFIKIVLAALFLRPRLYWLPASLPFLGIGETHFEPDFSIDKLTRMQIDMVIAKLNELETINSIRINNARRLAMGLIESTRFQIPGWAQDRKTIYLRLPVLCADAGQRNRAIQLLRKQGISASPMYPSSIRRIPGIEPYLADMADDFIGAESVVNRLLTLPTHPYLTAAHVKNILSCLNKL